MTDNVQSAMLEMLKRIQTDVSDVKTRVERLEARVERIDGRIEGIETIVKKQRRDSAALLVMMRGTVAIYEERISDLEDDVRLLQEQDS